MKSTIGGFFYSEKVSKEDTKEEKEQLCRLETQ